jgi:hypothetical protein
MTQAARFDRQAVIWRKAIASDPEYLTPDPDSGAERVAWVPIDGYQAGSPQIPNRVWGERQDILPGRSMEKFEMGLSVARNRSRWRMRWRSDIDSSMRMTIYGDGAEEFQIVAGPAEYAGRKEQIELTLEKLSS